MGSLETIAVVGASLAGLRAVEALRREGYEGRLALVGAEAHLPYDRPPLSKEILQGKWDVERTPLRMEQSYDELELDLRLGRRALALDPAGRRLELDDGSSLGFDGLVIATGAAPRALPGAPPLDGVYVLRTLEDAVAIREELATSPRVAVVGAGFIGGEVAASCRGRGLDVTLIEALPVPLATALGDAMGRLCAAIHRDHGVDLRCGVGVSSLEGAGRVERVGLSDGSAVTADLVIVGIGVAPVTDWLASSGLRIDDGVVCDARCFAAPGIVAAGDVARWHNPRFDETMRVEHWTNAVEQGTHAARSLLAGPDGGEPYAPVPFFWSDQYEAKIQHAGRSQPGDEIRIADGSLEERRFVALYGRAGRLTGVLALNRARLMMKVRGLLQDGASFDEALEALG